MWEISETFEGRGDEESEIQRRQIVTVQQREAFTAERLPGNVNSPGEALIFNGASLDASRICSAC